MYDPHQQCAGTANIMTRSRPESPRNGQCHMSRSWRLALSIGLLILPGTGSAAEAGDTWRFCPPAGEPVLAQPADANDDTVRISADSVSAHGEVYTLTGNAIVSRGRREISGDTLIYNRAESSVEAIGNVNFLSPDLIASGDRGKVYDETESGRLEKIEYTLPGEHGRGAAEVIVLDDRQHQRLEQASYTTCPPGNRDWLLYADEVTLDQTDGTGVAEHARFSLRGIPVLYTPWITFPIDDRRKTGLLIPRFGHSQESGYEASVPFYWNIAPNYDATITPRVMTRRGLMLGGEFRYLTGFGEGSLSGEYLPSDNEYDDGNRSLVSIQHRGSPAERLYTRIDASRVSDKDYFTDLGDDLVSSSKTHLRREAEATYHGHGWSADARVLEFQTVDPSISSEDRPYKQLPRLRFNAAPRHKWMGMRFSLDSELSEFDRDSSITGTRVDVQPRVTLPLRSRAWYLEPSASLRTTLYRLDNTRVQRRQRCLFRP
jgi:LPS-assembly protein